ncbi:MAG: hypothetical protein GC168_05020 [Candidatus Hydrogenedens sp.]|nr:hypothetical protein [Candidatus Hydrogenedens sp.]
MLGNPPVPQGNPITQAKVNLGKALFWDEQLSSTRTVSCGTCHFPTSGGVDARAIRGSEAATNPGPDELFGTADDVTASPGVPLCNADGTYEFSNAFALFPQVTGRTARSAIDAAFSPELFWDGRADDQFVDPVSGAVVLANGAALETQVLAPPVNSTEMAHQDRDWPAAAAQIAASVPLILSPQVPAALEAWIAGRDYPALFNEAFGDGAVTPVRIALAIATYERTLVSNQTPLDAQGGAQLTQQEQRGQGVFNRSNCNVCHRPPLFSDDQFHYTGVRPQGEDLGRFEVTGNPGDRGQMRTPNLRNAALRPSFMHGGQFATLEQVVDFYDRGGDFTARNLDNNIRPLNLNAQEKADLVAFLRRPLIDPRVQAGTTPFDRPALYTESDRVPEVQNDGQPGSGGAVPDVIALEPPLLGSPSFTVGIQNALGGATATLIIDTVDHAFAAQLPNNPALARATITLAGSGPGNGWGSMSIAIPAREDLLDTQLVGRWYVSDPGGANNRALSPAVLIRPFGIATESAPEGETTPEGEIVADGENTPDGEIVNEGEGATEGAAEGEDHVHPHCSDYDHNWRVDLSELLRVVQLFNVGNIHCDASQPDGFAPGTGDEQCTPHDLDYAPQNWRMDLAEVLRIVQFYNATGYRECKSSEDGYCPGE